MCQRQSASGYNDLVACHVLSPIPQLSFFTSGYMPAVKLPIRESWGRRRS